MVLVLVQDRCTVSATNHLGRTLMVLLDDEAQLEARFGPFRNSVNLDARSMHGLR